MKDPLIWRAAGARDMRIARMLLEEYQAAIGIDLCFQNFDDELATLPGAYAPPRGRLFLAGSAEAPIGCVALRPLPYAAADAMVGEVKRLYVRPQGRGTGLGRSLVEALFADARAIGYRELKLDTLGTMKAARELYASLGFRECEAYYANPIEGTVYMSLSMA